MKPNGKDGTPKLQILNGEYIMFYDDDIELALFLRKVVPQFQSAMGPYLHRLEAGDNNLFPLGRSQRAPTACVRRKDPRGLDQSSFTATEDLRQMFSRVGTSKSNELVRQWWRKNKGENRQWQLNLIVRVAALSPVST